ncbi:MAG: carbamoyltransferase HypF [Deltaproteobacteria bacterium]|nr:carbamoyltransferase HypF [Deltaproteobacteria bacterium]
MNTTKRAKGAIKGIVQGVGFRPFIYQLASRYNLTGYVTNTSQGVKVEVEGLGKDVERFFDAVVPERPPLAHIASLEWREIPPKKEAAFEIRISKAGEEKTALISPDVSICPDCLLELGDPQDRRFGYPFINCTNCGPRYTIIQDIPYDRDFTTMKAFQMCPACKREYHDPGNRRFHAQPNACRECGPGISLHNARAKKINCPDPIQEAIGLLEQGYILAIKGLGGFHLAVDASIHKAVVRLRRRKHREEKPLAMMVHDLAGARKVAHLDEVEAEILTSHQRPIVILKKRRFHGLSSQIAPKNTTFGIMLPYTPLHYLLMKGGFKALVMTSGNMTEEPIHINNDEAFKGLGDIADYFLVHNRDIYLRSDDSLVRVVDRQPRQIRRSRGFVPVPIFLPQEMSKLPSVLAVGGELKNTICLTKENRAFLSQHVGDMENLETLDFFHLTISHLKRILEIGPEVIAHDLHPDYLSTQYARQQRHLPIVAVQHHHAHIVSCLAEHGHNGPVIGLALDGTGYGADGRIWGGEVLLADLTSFKRAAHLETLPLPGGDGAARFPWRMALVYLDRAYGDGLFNLDLPYVRGLDKEQAVILLQMARQGVNAPHTSSCGRFFDAISALLGLRGEIAYEGQAAIELEMSRKSGEKGSYAFHIESEGDPRVMLTSGIVKGVVDDIIKGVGKGVISGRFHNTLINMFTESCILIREETGMDQVALSGGCFQNETLLTGLTRSLGAAGFAVLSHARVPANDGGLALGQAVCAGLRYAGVKGRYEVKGPLKKEA